MRGFSSTSLGASAAAASGFGVVFLRSSVATSFLYILSPLLGSYFLSSSVRGIRPWSSSGLKDHSLALSSRSGRSIGFRMGLMFCVIGCPGSYSVMVMWNRLYLMGSSLGDL